MNQFWNLTANRNEVAGRLLAAMGRAGIPSIVFTQNLAWTAPIAHVGADDLKRHGMAAEPLNEYENALFHAAAEELGNDGLVERPVEGLVGVHHGLLLLPERLAMESAFSRKALLALVATPTVAQGINLPAEAVVIAGDDRWQGNAEEGGPETLAAHELLNAAGRAGRAGHFAHGIVVDVPSHVHTVKSQNGTFLLSGLERIMGLFGLPDQCLDIVDPLTQVMDRIAHEGAVTDAAQYLVRRVGGLDGETLRGILRSSFGNAFRRDRDDVVAAQAAQLEAARAVFEDEDPDDDEWRALAAHTSTAPAAVVALAASIPKPDRVILWDFAQLQRFAIATLIGTQGTFFGLVDPLSSDFARILPRRKDEEIGVWEARWRVALEEVLPLWLGGRPLGVVGEVLHRHRSAKGNVKASHLGRRFALQASSGVGHGSSVLSRVVARKVGVGLPAHLRSWLSLLQGCFREGFDDPDKLILFWCLRRTEQGVNPRVVVHRRFADIEHSLPPWTDVPDDADRRRLIRETLRGR